MEYSIKNLCKSLIFVGFAFTVQSAGAMFNVDLTNNFSVPTKQQVKQVNGNGATFKKSPISPLDVKNNFVSIDFNTKKLTHLTDSLLEKLTPTDLSGNEKDLQPVPLNSKNATQLRLLPESPEFPKARYVSNGVGLKSSPEELERNALIKKFNDKIHQLEDEKQSLEQSEGFIKDAFEKKRLELEQLKNEKQLLVIHHESDLKERDELLNTVSIEYCKSSADSQNALRQLESEKRILENQVLELRRNENINGFSDVMNKLQVLEKLATENEEALKELEQKKIELGLAEIKNKEALKNAEEEKKKFLVEKTAVFENKWKEVDMKNFNLNKELLEHKEASKKVDAFKARVIYWSKAALFTGLAVTAVAAVIGVIAWRRSGMTVDRLKNAYAVFMGRNPFASSLPIVTIPIRSQPIASIVQKKNFWDWATCPDCRHHA